MPIILFIYYAHGSANYYSNLPNMFELMNNQHYEHLVS